MEQQERLLLSKDNTKEKHIMKKQLLLLVFMLLPLAVSAQDTVEIDGIDV